jgi:hypothetical protein
MRVSAVRFHSTHLNTLLASPAGGPPAVVASLEAMVGSASSRGLHLVLEKFVGCTGHTYIHNIYIVVRYSGTQKNDIYKKKKKLKNLKNKHTYLSSFYYESYGHIRIPREVDLGIGVVLYGQNLPRPPVENFIIEGLNGPPSPLSRQQHHPST